MYSISYKNEDVYNVDLIMIDPVKMGKKKNNDRSNGLVEKQKVIWREIQSST